MGWLVAALLVALLVLAGRGLYLLFKPRKDCAKCGAPPWQWCTECYVKRRRPT